MGVVYEAEQSSLRRRVALKVLPFAAALDPRQLQRFKNEALAAAHLRHENIVPVHTVGEERGVHYYAMDYINGPSLHEVVAQLSRPNRSASDERASGAHTDAAAARDARSSSAPSAVTVRPAGENGSAQFCWGYL
jgi:serine/threonine protein kinase